MINASRLFLLRSGVLPTAFLWAALVALRWQIVADMQLDVPLAIETGVISGILADLSATLVPITGAALVWAIVGHGYTPAWCLLAFTAWGSSLANTLYFRFFEIRLDWWAVRVHWNDVGQVKGSAADLGLTWHIGLSLLALLAAGAAMIAAPPRPAVSPWVAPSGRVWRRVLWRIAPIAVGVGLAQGVVQIPKLIGLHRQSSVISDNVLRWWWRQNTRDADYRASVKDWQTSLLPGEAGGIDLAKDRQVLARFARTPTVNTADIDPGEWVLEPAPAPGRPDWPLLWNLEHDAATTQGLRRRLGLPEHGPIHVVLLFLESVRAYELLEPTTAPLIYPRLREILEKHAVTFTTAYSSALNAGQTVRGQFSTQCSQLTNLGGVATYIAHSNLEVLCIAEALRRGGHQTVWVNSHLADYHGKRAFEVLHGVQKFYDQSYFRDRGITQRIGSWGLADKPVLEETSHLLNTLAKDGPPVFANVLTISTHHPHSVVPEGVVPEPLASQPGLSAAYLGYLSRLRYLDDSLGAFFPTLFASDMADRTLVVLLGDHGVTVQPRPNLTPPQWSDLRFRIPLALITKNMPSPATLAHPVHQMDVAPTLARIAGFAGEVPWLGRGLFAPQGSPWIYQQGDWVSFRAGMQGCYTRWGGDPTKCYDLSRGDPLFDPEPAQVPVDDATVRFYRSVVRAELRLNAFNGLSPRAGRGAQTAAAQKSTTPP